MDALDLLTTRRSVRELVEPAPDELELETVFQAATQVPDHGNLTPWRFVVITGSEAKQKFRRALEETVEVMKLGEDAMRKAEKVANFAPMIIAVIAAPNTSAEKPKPEARARQLMPSSLPPTRWVTTTCGLPACGAAAPYCAKP